MKLSRFGKKFTSESGILSLMDDLGNALAGEQDMIMMGGGNPGAIPEIESVFKDRLQKVLDDPRSFRQLIGVYDPPQGEVSLVKDLADMLKRTYGWNISERNIALTNGSQSAFFMLFNMFAGESEEGGHRKIQLPIAPEYIGYADAGLSDNFFTAAKPQIELLNGNLFKYHVDFGALKVSDETGAICVSRPTNPTGNVITDQEVAHLDQLAQLADVPLIIDGAYGTPFPNLIFTEATPHWNENTILCLSLSKLGLPAVRTGIVIANEEVIEALSGINAIINLASGSFGAVLVQDLVRSGEIMSLSREIVQPFYQQRAEHAVAKLRSCLPTELPYHIHKPEGAMFLWLWFENLPIDSQALYERLKQRGVLVVSGHNFFAGIDEDWRHKNECIRVTYSQQQDLVDRGIEIIADEVKKAYMGH